MLLNLAARYTCEWSLATSLVASGEEGGPMGEDDVAVWMADKAAQGTASEWQRGRVMHHLGNVDTAEVLGKDGEVPHLY